MNIKNKNKQTIFSKIFIKPFFTLSIILLYFLSFLNIFSLFFVLGLLGWIFDEYNLLPFFISLFIFISVFIVEPFLRFSIYPPENDNDKLAEFVKQHCSVRIFKLFKYVKTKMRLQDKEADKIKKKIKRRNSRLRLKKKQKKI